MFGNRNGKIGSFDIITLRETGMRGSKEYEIVMKDGKAEVSFYRIKYTQGKDCRVLDRRAVCSVETVIGLLNDCNILSWNGFVGKHPKGVLDGIMFTFEAIVDQGEKIYAHGSENFPKHYRDLRNGLYEILNDKG
jgi:hypothetical protein